MKATILVLMLTLAACGGGTSAPSSPSGGRGLFELDGGVLTDDAGTCDCRGLLLPDFCLTCSDGGIECVHYACVQGRCGTAVCGSADLPGVGGDQ